MARKTKVTRTTAETRITIELDLDGGSVSRISTGIGFFDHLLDALRKHAGFNLVVEAQGDLHIDGHHTVEDVGIVLGQALADALGDGRNISRFGHAYCPLDEALARAVVDVSGRPFLNFICPLTLQQVGEFAGELFEEFLRAFAINARLTLHVELLYGRNQHHAMESMIKAVARALRAAVAADERQNGIPSTKGVLI
jgi:imidazoleglycerol-phosphate dehydratase